MNVLLVEDNDQHAELVAFAIEPLVDNLERACNGEEAVARLLSVTGRRPDLVLMDINMPRMDGIEVLQRVKSVTGSAMEIPIVMLTTSNSREDRQRAYSEHANGYVVKPVDFDELERMLTDVIKFWGHWNKTPYNPA